ncbi:glycosyltransferase [Lentzea sp. NBRC 105346]|uniref:glycosyltransferase n=1 Tax=Lentzea sp. NBRC 105346 TaxID=3032205 RepID=UPI0025524FF2|nr:glycosyltransferase [Lentzea sp. NBRC 105346]
MTVGLTVAAVGQLILLSLIRAGWEAWLANVVQVAVTLQLNFLGNRHFTWCRRLEDSRFAGVVAWWRFHWARGASAVLSVAAFPVLAPRLGHSAAYWVLLAAGAVLNFCTDRFWSFGGGGVRPVARVLCVLGVLAAGVFVAARYLDVFIVLVSVFMLVVTVTTLGFQLYRWWRPQPEEPDHRDLVDPPRLPGVILVPMRFEEAVAGRTLDRLATLDHPNYLVVPIVDHADDPGTAGIAHAKAREFPGRVLVCPYPEDIAVHNKPIGLNAALEYLEREGVRFEWVGVADAEDLFHPDLLRVVDHRFRETNAAVVQSGVQLMNFHAHPEAVPRGRGRWWRANLTGWWRAANVLEYFKWFQSRLKLQAAAGVMPLGGNTVFFRHAFLRELRDRYGSCWDGGCLTEDCKIGILASVLGLRVEVIYSHELVTREETPTTLAGLLRQRVRWMQGFIQVFREGDWLSLPSMTQRVLAVYVLGFQFFQAFAAAFAPVALALAIWHKSPVVVTLLATVPLGLGLLAVALDVVLLRQFSRTFGIKARVRDYFGLVVGAYPFQLVLSCAALWAILRHAADRTDWVKTTHAGAHLKPAVVAR